MWFSSHLKPAGKTAVVFGASQGVGADIACQLYEQGCSVVLVARTKSKLEKQVKRIKSKSSAEGSNTSVTYISCDASDYKACVKFWDELINEREQDPDFIFCCAGSSIPKLFEDLTEEELISGINTNYYTALFPIHTGFKALKAIHNRKEFKPRTVALFSSIVGYYPFIGYGQYAPAKAALQSLATILRQELKPYNFRVVGVYPGSFASEGFDQEELTKPAITKTIEGPSKIISSEECARVILRRIDQGQDFVNTDTIGWFLASSASGIQPRSWYLIQIIFSLLFAIIGPIVNWFMDNDIAKFHKQRESESNIANQPSVKEDNAVGHDPSTKSYDESTINVD